jgi:WD40 repeat protein
VGALIPAVVVAVRMSALARIAQETAAKDQHRFHQALVEQARAERLTANRWRALELLAEAANVERTDDLRQEAVEAITSPGIRLARERRPRAVPDLGTGPFVNEGHEFSFPRLSDLKSIKLSPADKHVEARLKDKTIAVLPERLVAANKVRISDDERWLAFADPSEEDLIRIWDCRRQCQHSRLVGQGEVVLPESDAWRGTAFSPDGVLVASTYRRAGDFVLALDEVSPNRRVSRMSGVLGGWWSSDSRYLLTWSEKSITEKDKKPPDGTMVFEMISDGIRVAWAQAWQVACPVPVFAARGSIQRLQFRDDGRQLAVNEAVWDVAVENDRPVLRQTAIEATGGVVAFQGREAWAVSLAETDRDRDVSLVCARLGGALLLCLPGSGRPPSAPDLAGVLSRMRTFDWLAPRLVRLAPAGRQTQLQLPNSLLFPEGREFLANSERVRMRVFAARPMQPVWSPDGKKLLAAVRIVQYDIGNKSLGFAGYQGDALVLWELDSASPRRVFSELFAEYKDYAFQPNGPFFVTAGERGLQLWESAQGTHIRALSPQHFARVTWSRDGQSLLAIAPNEKAVVFTPAGEERRQWPAPAGEWNAFALSNDGRRVVTGGEDRLLRVHDVQTGKEIARWQGHEAAITALTFSPDGKLLVSGARDGTVRVWNLPWIRAELAKLGLNWDGE